MKSLIVLTGALLLMAVPPAAAGDAGVETTIRQFADAFNKGDMKAAKALHIAAPTIIDGRVLPTMISAGRNGVTSN